MRAFLRGSIGLRLKTLTVPAGGVFLGGFFVDTLALLALSVAVLPRRRAQSRSVTVPACAGRRRNAADDPR